MRDFNHTVNVLVKAYLNNTLEHGNCFACAVGNIVAESTGRKLTPAITCNIPGEIIWEGEAKKYPIGKNGWAGVINTGCMDYDITVDMAYYKGEPKKQIDSTGYSIEELAKIEWAFERAPYGESDEDWMYNGLLAVVDVLAEIHGISLEQKSEAKAMFVKETL